jgi:hypothetical protein
MNFVCKAIGFFGVLSNGEVREDLAAVAPDTRRRLVAHCRRIIEIAEEMEESGSKSAGPLAQLGNGERAEDAHYIDAQRGR